MCMQMTAMILITIAEMVTGTVLLRLLLDYSSENQDHVIKRKHFPRYWPFGRGIHSEYLPILAHLSLVSHMHIAEMAQHWFT